MNVALPGIYGLTIINDGCLNWNLTFFYTDHALEGFIPELESGMIYAYKKSTFLERF